MNRERVGTKAKPWPGALSSIEMRITAPRVPDVMLILRGLSASANFSKLSNRLMAVFHEENGGYGW
jgi:hypothetical protein